MSARLARTLAGATLGLCLVAAGGVPATAAGSVPASAGASSTVAEAGVQVAVGEVDLDGPAVNPVTVTLTNSAAKPLTRATVSLSGPVGWTVSGPQSVDTTLRTGQSTALTFWVQVPETRPGFRTYTFTATATYKGGDGAGTATASRTARTGTVLPDLSAAFNNVGVTDESATTAGDFDGDGNSFSAQKLADVGITPGGSVTAVGASFTWPSAAPGTPGNVASAGQGVALSGSGSRLAFLGSGSSYGATGTVTVFYTDGTSSSGTLGFPNWSFQEADAHGATLVASSIGRNRPSGYGDAAYPYRVFANSVAVDPGKTVEFVVLPTNGAVHVFDMVLVS